MAAIDSYNVLSFSGGRTSALMTIEYLKSNDAVVIFSNTGKENEETLKFVHQVDEYLGGQIVWVEYNSEQGFVIVNYETASREGEPFAELIRKRKFLPNRVTRFCTQELKIRPIKKYCQQVLGWKHWTNLVGIRYDEPGRWSKSKSVERKEVFDVEHPLVKWKITKPDVLSYWAKMPFDLELKEHEGNCDICFLKGRRKKQIIAREHPDKFNWWIQREKEIGGTFVKGESYSRLLEIVANSPEIQFDDTIECFCNID